MVIQIPCEQVVREVSNYLDGEIKPELSQRMEHHFRGCHRCCAVLNGTRNVVALIGDERTFTVPPGFGERLYSRLRTNLGS
jgi:predicted anti-sigma-YlaC factor YlaD